MKYWGWRGKMMRLAKMRILRFPTKWRRRSCERGGGKSEWARRRDNLREGWPPDRDQGWPPGLTWLDHLTRVGANTLKDQSKKGLNTYDHWDLRLIRPERQINLERSLRPKLLRPVWPVTNISKFKDHSETKTLKDQYEKGWPLKYIGQVWRWRPPIGTL